MESTAKGTAIVSLDIVYVVNSVQTITMTGIRMITSEGEFTMRKSTVVGQSGALCAFASSM